MRKFEKMERMRTALNFENGSHQLPSECVAICAPG